MEVDVATIVRWSARSVGIAVAAFFFLTLIRETIALAESGGLGQLSTGTYLTMSLVWIAAIGLVIALRWPFFGGFLTLAVSFASIMIILLSHRGLQPQMVLVAAAGVLYILDGSFRNAGERARFRTA